MRDKYIQNQLQSKIQNVKNQSSRVKTIKKRVSALTVVMIGLASGMMLTDEEILAFTNTTPEIELTYEIEAKPQINTRKSMLSSWEEVDDTDTTDTSDTTEEEINYEEMDETYYDEYTSEEDMEDDDEEEEEESEEESEEDESSYSIDIADDLSDDVLEDVIKNGSDYKNFLNTATTANRFDHIDVNYKKAVKGIFSSKYYSKKMNLGYGSSTRSWDARIGNVYRLYNYIPLRKGVESKFGIKNVYGNKDTWAGYQASTLSMVLSRNKVMESALTNKENREYLTQLAVDAGITTAEDAAAPEAALAVYYGILNNDLSNTNFKYNANKKMTREQFAVMYGKFVAGWSYDDFAADEDIGSVGLGLCNGKNSGDSYNKLMYKYRNSKTIKWSEMILHYYGSPVSPDNVSYKQFTKGQVSRIEIICMLSTCFAEQSTSGTKGAFNYKKSNYVAVSDSYIKKIIKKYGISSNPSQYLAKAKKLNKGYGLNSGKQIINKTKQFGYVELQAIARCHKLGIIKPNANGKYNWYGSVTQAQALKLMTKGAMECTTYYARYDQE